MSTFDSWDSWDSWGRAPGGGGGGSGGIAFAALGRSRESMVFGDPPTFERPAGWPNGNAGSALRFLAPKFRQRVFVFDLLNNLRVESRSPLRVQVGFGGALQSFDAPNRTQFRNELALVEAAAELRAERGAEIVAQLDFNPAFWASVLPMSRLRTPYTLELLQTVVAFASFVVQRVKVMLNLPRPNEMSPRIQPMIPTPGHSTFPSGHATEANLVASVLQALVLPSLPAGPWRDALPQMLGTLADRIADNRVVAGLHFPADGQCGKLLATTVLLPRVIELGMAAAVTEPARTDNSFAWLWQRAGEEWTGA